MTASPPPPPAEASPRELISVPELARRSSYSRPFLYRLLQRGEVEGVKGGSRNVRIYVDSFRDWLERNRVGG